MVLVVWELVVWVVDWGKVVGVVSMILVVGVVVIAGPEPVDVDGSDAVSVLHFGPVPVTVRGLRLGLGQNFVSSLIFVLGLLGRGRSIGHQDQNHCH